MTGGAVGLVLKDPPCGLVAQVAPDAERRGFTHLLFPELSIPGDGPITGRDPFVSAAIALGATARLHAGTAVAGTVFHTARHLALRAATLQEQSGGRFVLGCGVSHGGFADAVGVPYPTSPLDHVRGYCAELRTITERLAFGAGFPVWLAALGERMAATAADCADGLILNWVSPEWTRRTVALATESAGRRPTVAVLLRVGPRQGLRAAAARYLGMFGNYTRHFARQDLPDADAVVDATCAPLDGGAALAERAAAYREAGADVVCLYPADLEPRDIAAFVAGAEI